MLIQHAYENREIIICMVDLNTDVRNMIITKKFNQWEMRDITLKDREEDGIETPATCNGGTLPIDGSFASRAIFSIACGYLGHGEFPSDKRALWVDICTALLFGRLAPPIITPHARWL